MVDNSLQGHGQAFRYADGNDDFTGRIVFNPIMFVKIIGNGFTQFGKARVTRVSCFFIVKAVNHGLPNLIGRCKIRFADT